MLYFRAFLQFLHCLLVSYIQEIKSIKFSKKAKHCFFLGGHISTCPLFTYLTAVLIFYETRYLHKFIRRISHYVIKFFLKLLNFPNVLWNTVDSSKFEAVESDI